jgi:hypothetical protein
MGFIFQYIGGVFQYIKVIFQHLNDKYYTELKGKCGGRILKIGIAFYKKQAEIISVIE